MTISNLEKKKENFTCLRSVALAIALAVALAGRWSKIN